MKVIFEDFTITGNRTGSKPSTWGAGRNQHHTITVKRGDKFTRFDFWTSMAEPVMKTDYDLLNAFYNFVTDALAGMDDFGDFCGNFGFEDPGRALEAWKACKRAAAKLARIYPGDIWELADRLQEVAA